MGMIVQVAPAAPKKPSPPPPVMVPWYCQQKTVLYWDLGDLILEQPMIYYLCRDRNASSGSHIILTTQNACHLFKGETMHIEGLYM